MADPYANFGDTLLAQANRAVAITPSTTQALTDLPKALYVGTGGNLALRGTGDKSPVLWKNVPSGAVLPFRAQFVCDSSAGTTAADIVALY